MAFKEDFSIFMINIDLTLMVYQNINASKRE